MPWLRVLRVDMDRSLNVLLGDPDPRRWLLPDIKLQWLQTLEFRHHEKTDFRFVADLIEACPELKCLRYSPWTDPKNFVLSLYREIILALPEQLCVLQLANCTLDGWALGILKEFPHLKGLAFAPSKLLEPKAITELL